MTPIQSVELSPDDHLLIADHARVAFPAECCGVLIGRRLPRLVLIERVVRAENITEADPMTSYQVDWKTLLATRRSLRGGRSSIVGFYHSHPDATSHPSQRDRELAWPDHVYLIVPVSRLEVGCPVAWYAGGEAASGELEPPGGVRDTRGKGAPPPH